MTRPEAAPSPISPASLFLSPKGRIGRRLFMIGVIALVCLLAMFQWAAAGEWWHVPAGWLFYPAWIYAAVCVLAKRLRDRGRSAWWSAPILVGFNFVWPWPDSLAGIAALIVVGWAAVELGWKEAAARTPAA